MAITKETYDALPAEAQSHFIQTENGYDTPKEDVEALKKSKAEILEEKKKAIAELNELKKFKSEIEARSNADEEEKLKAAGEFKQLEEKLRAKITEIETARDAEKSQLLNNFKTEKLKNELTARGVLPDRAKYALSDVAEQVDLVSGDDGFSWKVKNGIGDAKEFDALIEGLKSNSPFFFAANSATGSGATGSNGASGNAKQIPHSQWKSMSLPDQAAFINSGGSIAD
jgi:hypothetical protein